LGFRYSTLLVAPLAPPSFHLYRIMEGPNSLLIKVLFQELFNP